MPYGSRFDASSLPWQVLIVGPDNQAPQLMSTLRTIDPNVLIDRAESIEAAEDCIASAVHYDAAFVLDTVALGPNEHAEELAKRLSVGRTPPPLVAIATSPAAPHPLHLEPFIPVVLEADEINLRQLIRALRSARDLHRSTRLGRLLIDVGIQLAPTERGHLSGLQSAVEALNDAIDVAGTHLVLSSNDHELHWELSAGDALDSFDDLTHRRSTLTSPPVMTLRRETPTFSATLQLGPLSASSQARISDHLTAFLDLILDRLQLGSDQRASERASIAHQLFTDSTDSPPPSGPAGLERSRSKLQAGLELMAGALPELGTGVVDALNKGDLTILHQPILSAAGAILESDMLLGVTMPRSTTGSRAQVVDLSPLDSLDSVAAGAVTSELTVPAGLWLIAKALPTLSRLQDSGELDHGHRIHLGLLHRQLADNDTVELIIKLLAEHEIDAHSLAIDVAEPTLLEHHDTVAAMSRLAGLGVDLYLDGFGGVGSNFTLLRTQLVRGVRLPQRVIRGVSVDDRQASIVSGLIALCDELGLEVIATGVDHRADFDWLTEYGHISLQGNLIGAAMTEDELLGGRVAQAS